MLIGGEGGVKSEVKYLLNLNHFKTSGDYTLMFAHQIVTNVAVL